MDMSFFFSLLFPKLGTTSLKKKKIFFFPNSIEIEKTLCFEKLFLRFFQPLNFLDSIVIWYNTIPLCFDYLVGWLPALAALEEFEGRAFPVHRSVLGVLVDVCWA